MKAKAPGKKTKSVSAVTFGADTAFLQQHTKVIVLSDRAGKAQVAVAPAWQARVMTSTSAGAGGASYGWINRKLIADGKLQPHINVYGGEDRFWLGPEGGQFSIFFAPGAKFELSDWYTPPAIDHLPFAVTRQSKTTAKFRSRFAVGNYSGTRFEVVAEREVKLLTAKSAAEKLGAKIGAGVSVVAYETVNQLSNAGAQPWEQATGLLSIWILGMFNPSASTTVVVPIKPGPVKELGPKVTADYFGKIPAERLAVGGTAVFFRGDGEFRSKIGISPKRSRAVLGSYDAAGKVLTIIQFTQPEGATEYVNSLWKLQKHPYAGDAINSYNDGPPTPGAKSLGPFYELESSSPAAALAPGEKLTHVHRTIHLTGPVADLDAIALSNLGVSLAEIQSALPAA